MKSSDQASVLLAALSTKNRRKAMTKIVAMIALALLLSGCVDGRTGKFFWCGVTVTCK